MPLDLVRTRTVRIGVTGLARAGKTAFLTSVASNLLACGAGRPVLPKLSARLAAKPSVSIADAGASALPRFDVAGHLASLAQDPPVWPARTDASSLLALDLSVPRSGWGSALPPLALRLEWLDYPGEWLLDLPLLQQDFSGWSEAALRRLEGMAEAAPFLGFATALPAAAPADEALAATGHRLYRDLLGKLRDRGLANLQPGRFLMPAPGAPSPWIEFFPMRGRGGLHELLSRRFAAYQDTVRRDLSDPLFGRIDRMVVLVDLLSALSAGPEPFDEMRAALAEAARSLRWSRGWLEAAVSLGRLRWPAPVIRRVAFATSKADHVSERQRGNLASLLRNVVSPAASDVPAGYFALAAVRCTKDTVMRIGEHAVSAVHGRRSGDGKQLESYPGEVPDTPPGEEFWRHPFLRIPEFEPFRLAEGGRGGVQAINLDALLLFLLDDVL